MQDSVLLRWVFFSVKNERRKERKKNSGTLLSTEFINVNARRVQVHGLYFFLARLLNIFSYTQNINYNREDQGVSFPFSDNP